MSDAALIAITVALPPTILAIATLAVGVRNSRKVDKIESLSDKTHTLVNSNMGVQLKLNAVVSRRMADLTKDPGDIRAAVSAERLLAEHEGKQRTVDEKELENPS